MSKISGTQAAAWWLNPRTGSVTHFADYSTSGSWMTLPATSQSLEAFGQRNRQEPQEDVLRLTRRTEAVRLVNAI
jgi:hypothetical protein